MSIRCGSCGGSINFGRVGYRTGRTPVIKVCKSEGIYYCIACGRDKGPSCPRCGEKMKSTFPPLTKLVFPSVILFFLLFVSMFFYSDYTEMKSYEELSVISPAEFSGVLSGEKVKVYGVIESIYDEVIFAERYVDSTGNESIRYVVRSFYINSSGVSVEVFLASSDPIVKPSGHVSNISGRYVYKAGDDVYIIGTADGGRIRMRGIAKDETDLHVQFPFFVLGITFLLFIYVASKFMNYSKIADKHNMALMSPPAHMSQGNYMAVANGRPLDEKIRGGNESSGAVNYKMDDFK